MGEVQTLGFCSLKDALGLKLQGVRRFILGLGTSNDETGHGITILTLGDKEFVVRPGPNEDYIEVAAGPIDTSGLDSEHWTEVDLTARPEWYFLVGRELEFVDCYSDGIEDVALVFNLAGGQHFSLALCDTDLVIAEELEPFQKDPERTIPVFRERIAITKSHRES